MNSARLLIHPVRSRVVTSLIGRKLTTRQIADLLPDVPVPSLYRNLKVLLDAGALTVVEELPVRGVVERVYALSEGAGNIDRTDVAAMTSRERHEMLQNFLNMLSISYRSYQEAGGDEPAKSVVTALYLTDEQEREVFSKIREIVDRHRTSAEGKRKLFAVISQPEIEPEGP